MKKTRRTFRWKWAVFLLPVILSTFALSLYRWTFATWPNLQLDELIFHMKVSVEGTSAELVRSGVISVLGPTVAVPVLMSAAGIWLARRKAGWASLFCKSVCVLAAAVLLATGFAAWQRFGLSAYLFGSSEEDFIQDNYVDPAKRSIVFPEEKKNLIYIYLESMETTFADKASGGAFEENVIPELTELALSNEDFSGSSAVLNGGQVLNGCTWTMGALFAQTSGLPLKIAIDDNAMNTQEHFFPALTTLGDILEDAGYRQTVLIGSDATFGGGTLYFQEHGNYAIHDYFHALLAEKLPSDYYEWWGYEDQKLFEYAREEAAALAAQGDPFNLTLFTMDTHFEDGYTCELCPADFDDPYSNVYACASKQVHDFVEWVKAQDFYEDTVIVLAGDHRTMDSDYKLHISPDYDQRVLVSFINAQKEYAGDQPRQYSTLDLFPTTLSALGADIEGDRLGLGADLFSAAPTLLEMHGKDAVNKGLSLPSPLMEKLGQIKRFAKSTPEIRLDPASQMVRLGVYDIRDLEGEIVSAEVVITDENGSQRLLPLTLQPDSSYAAEVELSSFETDFCTIEYLAYTNNKHKYQLAFKTGSIRLLSAGNIEAYLKHLTELEDVTIFMAASYDASSELSDEAAGYLRMLDVSTELQELCGHGFYAVISPEGISEDYYTDTVEDSGILPDGAYYEVYSSGSESETPEALIFIDGTQLSPNHRGLNFVIYDHTKSYVVDAAYFDTCHDATRAELVIQAEQQDRSVFQLTGLDDAAPAYCLLYCWQPDQPEKALEMRLEPQSNGVYASQPVSQTLSAGHVMEAFAVGEDGRMIRLSTSMAPANP